MPLPADNKEARYQQSSRSSWFKPERSIKRYANARAMVTRVEDRVPAPVCATRQAYAFSPLARAVRLRHLYAHAGAALRRSRPPFCSS